MYRSCACVVCVCALAFVSGCVGSVGAGEGSGSAPGSRGTSAPAPGGAGTAGRSAGAGGSGGVAGTGGGGAATAVLGDPNLAGPMPLRRLTRREYDNTIRDLLGLAGEPSRDFPLEGHADSGFATAGLVQAVDFERLQSAAERLAQQAAATRLSALVPCSPANGEGACARAFIQSFGKRAFRRPLAPTEVTELEGLFTAVKGQGYSFADAIAVLIEAALQSAPFLYRWELGSEPAVRDGALVRLGPYEVASRLSYLLWSSMPDAALFAAADAGKLATPPEIAQQARRMLADPRAQNTIDSFEEQWLGVEGIATMAKNPKLFPDFGDTLKAAFTAEIREFAREILLRGDGRVESLLLSSTYFVNSTLAKIYGVTAVSGTALRPQALEPAQRFGVLTQAAFLASKASASDPSLILRGAFVRERLLCQALPPPPGDVPAPPPRDATLTTREFFAQQHEREPRCASCHKLIDPIGFALEGYDALGKTRATENGKPIDVSGSVSGIDGGDRAVSGPRELAQVLAASEEVRRCVARQWFRFGFGRADSDDDASSLKAAHAAFAAAGFNVRELLVALVTTRSFLYRKPAVGEVLR